MTSLGAETFRSILTLKEFFLLAATRKNETKLRKTEKNMEKENTTDGNDLVKMRYQIQILWNLF